MINFSLCQSATAVFSTDRRYRYLLTRVWDRSGGSVLFVGLNPSLADETTDDATLRKCLGFAKRWGFGSLKLINLFALVAPKPQTLYVSEDPVGRDNDVVIQQQLACSDLVVAAWGSHGNYLARAKQVRQMLPATTKCLKLNKDGEPAHPLYISYSTDLVNLFNR